MMRALMLGLAFAAGTSEAAFATELPSFDIDAICAANQSAYHTPVATCIYINQQAYNGLRLDWPDLSEYVRTNSIEQCRKSGPRPDYAMLQSCVFAWRQREDNQQQLNAISASKHFQR